jgi:hypothetical protein
LVNPWAVVTARGQQTRTEFLGGSDRFRAKGGESGMLRDQGSHPPRQLAHGDDRDVARQLDQRGNEGSPLLEPQITEQSSGG